MQWQRYSIGYLPSFIACLDRFLHNVIGAVRMGSFLFNVYRVIQTNLTRLDVGENDSVVTPKSPKSLLLFLSSCQRCPIQHRTCRDMLTVIHLVKESEWSNQKPQQHRRQPPGDQFDWLAHTHKLRRIRQTRNSTRPTLSLGFPRRRP